MNNHQHSIVLINGLTGDVWTGDGFSAELEDAKHFTPIEGLKAAFEMPCDLHFAEEGGSVEIHYYCESEDRCHRIISAQSAVAWPVTNSAFQRFGIELDRTAFIACRTYSNL